MSTERWQRAEDLLHQVLEHAPEDRAEYLANACGEDAELLAEVESLLAHHEAASIDFLQPPEPPADVKRPMVPDGPDPRIGTSVGGYRIEKVIASGGMGTVYEAVQAEPRRTVALKVLHRHAASQSALRRFRFESQILAHLRHPNIAQVFAAGMHEEGSVQVPYFAMEYVPDARTITEYVRDEKLSIKDRLSLFVDVCEAVHHGHQKGIIHRDLKPGNILVDSSSRPKIIDFGVARSTDSDIAMTTMQTDAGQIIGTLQYMSPEQCNAVSQDIDTRCDVYSLGVVLYQLLTGRLPYDVSHMTIHSATRLICEQPPAKPSEFERRLRGDLETIVLKALEKIREQRYQSAAELAGDVVRFIKGEPIDARPPTTWTRAMRWVARHPITAVTAACLAIAGLTLSVTVAGIWYYGQRPYDVVPYRSGLVVNSDEVVTADEARLVSLGGHFLHHWGGNRDSIEFAKLANRKTESGEVRLALVGFSPTHGDAHRRALCAFDLEGDLDEPVWQSRVKDDDPIPDPYNKGYKAIEFKARECWLYDVFPELPGSEVVVRFDHISSQRIIRIHDLDGKLLYEAWHDGTLASCCWMEDPGLLVFAGTDATVNWDSEGKLVRPQGDPLVFFAIRPQLQPQDPGHLWGHGEHDDTSLAWKKYVHLEGGHVDRDSEWMQRVEVRPVADGDEPFVVVSLFRREASAGISWKLDELGDVVPDSRREADGYSQNRLDEDNPDRLPDPNRFHLRDIPPTVALPPVSQ